MNGMEVILPGGLWDQVRLQKLARFRPVSGHLEREIAEPRHGMSRPERVTELLSLALESIGGTAVDQQHVESLCVADRQYLMMQLAILLDGDMVWLRSACGRCGNPFDIDIRRSELPVREAGATFPFASVMTSIGDIELRVPTGGDQAAIAGMPDADAVSQLFRRCVRLINGEEADEATLDSLAVADMSDIEQALEDVSPAVCETLLGECPECGHRQQIGTDPYGFDMFKGTGFYEEVHMLALHYHWSEADILALPRTRRQQYLNMVERDAGRYVGVEA